MAISDREYYAAFGLDMSPDKLTQSYVNFMVLKTLENLRDRIENFANENCSGDDINIYDVFRIINEYEEALRYQGKNS